MWREALRAASMLRRHHSMMERDELLCHLMSPTNDNTSSDDRGEERERERERETGNEREREGHHIMRRGASRLLACNVGRARPRRTEEKLTFLTAILILLPSLPLLLSRI